MTCTQQPTLTPTNVSCIPFLFKGLVVFRDDGRFEIFSFPTKNHCPPSETAQAVFFFQLESLKTFFYSAMHFVGLNANDRQLLSNLPPKKTLIFSSSFTNGTKTVTNTWLVLTPRTEENLKNWRGHTNVEGRHYGLLVVFLPKAGAAVRQEAVKWQGRNYDIVFVSALGE